MLENFDQAKRDLAKVRDELARTRANEGPDSEIEFLKSRALDLLRNIYVDSESTLNHIKEIFVAAKLNDVLSIIDHALRVSPPVGRALSSEEDGRTIQALVDAAVWRSRIVWIISWTTGALIVITLAALGYTVIDLNKQADKAREAIAQAREKAQDAIMQMSRSVDEIGKSTVEIETKKKAIDQNVAALEKRLGNPNDEINRVTLRFDSELTRLSDLEQEWTRRREKIGSELAGHVSFLIGEEDKVTRKTSEFNQLVSQHAATIEPLAKGVTELQSKVTSIVEASKKDAEAFGKQIGALQNDAATVHTLLDQSGNIVRGIGENAEKAASAQRVSESSRNTVQSIETELRQAMEGAKATIERLSKSFENEQRSFEEHARTQRESFDDAAAAAQKSVEDTTGNVNRIAAQTIASLNSAQTNAGQYLQTIGTAQEGAAKQATEAARISNAVSQLQTEITTKFENLKTDEQRLKGERDRAKLELDKAYEIINIVEDKRSEVSDKLHKMLDARPSLDSAAAWKLVLASNVLLVISASSVFLLLALVFLLVLLIRSRRPSINAPAS